MRRQEYDILSYGTDGDDRFIKGKTTKGRERTPFHITRNELAVAETRRNDWRLIRMWNFARQPQAFELRPPLEAHVSLMASFLCAGSHHPAEVFSLLFP